MRNIIPRRFLLTVLVWVCLPCVLAASVAAAAQGQYQETQRDAILSAYLRVQEELAPGLRESPSLPPVKTDPSGRIWTAWENWQDGESRVHLGRCENGELVDRQTIDRRGETDRSPDFCFGPDGTAWVIWVSETAGGGPSRIFVKDMTSNRGWLLDSQVSASVTDPKIVSTPSGSIWAFWNVTAENSGEIIYRIFNAGIWSPPESVPRGEVFPALNPEALSDLAGTIWLAWSSYDGQDYEIFLTQWSGASWAGETRITDNSDADLFPTLGLKPPDGLWISWTQSSGSSRLVRTVSFADGNIHQETVLPASGGLPVFSKIISSAGQAAAIWKSENGLVFRDLFPSSQGAIPVSPSPHSAPPENLILDDTRYVGFGDSITFGYIDFDPYPERGYIPRLDAILDQNFGPQRMINEGFGGEITAEGLSRLDKVFIADRARYTLIMEGTNDVIFNSISIDAAAANIKEMARKCLAKGVLPIIATIIPRRDWVWSEDLYRGRLLSLNDKIRLAAADLKVPLVDMYAAFNTYPVSSGGLASLLSKDLKHPSDKGYQFMAETWFTEIRNLPFPPANFELKPIIPSSAPNPKSSKKAGSSSELERRPVASGEDIGNRLTWSPSPKIFDPTKISGYRIYRKNRLAPQASFEMLVFVQNALEYLDRGISVLNQYDYRISTVRNDGLEGPPADLGR
jgi:lysophospholipase L1-like esterase